jgi:hypothetical protein
MSFYSDLFSLLGISPNSRWDFRKKKSHANEINLTVEGTSTNTENENKQSNFNLKKFPLFLAQKKKKVPRKFVSFTHLFTYLQTY